MTPSIPDRLTASVDILSEKLGAALMFGPHLLVVAEWIVTGDSKRPTLARMLHDAYGDLPPDVDAACGAALFIATHMDKMPVLECYVCGARKAKCLCCPTHRMADLFVERCGDCVRAPLSGSTGTCRS